jgi:hypothetical protein
MLQNAVLPVPDLRAVETKAYQLKAQSGTDLTYDQYVNLLVRCLICAEDFLWLTPFLSRVYSHDITEYSDDGGNVVYDIDCTLDVIQANAHASASARQPGTTRPPSSSMAFPSRPSYLGC